MSAINHYDITVSRCTPQDSTQRHYFTAELPGHYSPREVGEFMDDLRARFPQHEGFQVTCTHWRCAGHLMGVVQDKEASYG